MVYKILPSGSYVREKNKTYTLFSQALYTQNYFFQAMTNTSKYALIGFGGLLLGSALGGLSFGYVGLKKGYDRGYAEGHEKGSDEGYQKGYDESEPEVYILSHNRDKAEGLCVMLEPPEAICALDKNYDGAVDVILIDRKTREVKKEKLGQMKVCTKNGYEVACTLNLDDDSFPDTIVMDLKEGKIKEIRYGKDAPLEDKVQ